MRILQVNAYHRKVGGAEVYLHQLSDALRARGHAVALFAQDPEEERDAAELRVVKRADFDPERLILDAPLASELRRFAQSFRPDLVHAHNLHVFPATFPRVLAELGVPVLLHPHEFGLLCPNAWCVWPDGTPCSGGPGAKCFEHDCSRNYPIDARNVLVARLRFLAARETAAAVVCGSDALAELLRANGFPCVRSLRYFAQPAKFGGLEALERLRAATPREPARLLFLGRLEREKGVDVLLRALPGVLARRPDVHLSIVGGGSQRAALERLAAELGLAHAVEFTGPVPHETVPSWLARATLQVLPSIWAENAAQSCYDCLMLGLPLVASRVAALPEVVREGVNGLLFTPRDPADLARAILRGLEEPGLAARLSQGCAGELARYDERAHVTALEELYAELRAGPRAALPALEAEAEAETALLIERLDGLLLEKERAFVAADREARARGEALDTAVAERDGALRERDDARTAASAHAAEIERLQRALEARRGHPGSLRRALTNVLDRLSRNSRSA
jgi:glycosyltransferase involved in cell wall biosynthesis